MKKIKVAVFVVLSIVLMFGTFVYQSFFTIQWINGEELLSVTESLDGSYSVTIYRNNGGATTSFAILGTLEHANTGEKRNIYWQYQCDEAKVVWIDETTVDINGIVLDVTKDVYDYRNAV
ncbi:MAG: DUF5412 family protein [Eubacteriales bacterium]